MKTRNSGIRSVKSHLDIQDPTFWRAGAISTTLVMLVVLAFLTVDSLRVITAGGANVPPYDVINQHIDYQRDWAQNMDTPVIGGPEPLFGRKVTAAEAESLILKGKLVIQSRACMDCHTIFGNGAYYGPDLTKAWLDPAWDQIWMPMTRAGTREDDMVMFLMHPDRYPTWARRMPNLQLSQDEAKATVAYLKWLASVNTNGFPANFGKITKN